MGKQYLLAGKIFCHCGNEMRGTLTGKAPSSHSYSCAREDHHCAIVGEKVEDAALALVESQTGTGRGSSVARLRRALDERVKKIVIRPGLAGSRNFTARIDFVWTPETAEQDAQWWEQYKYEQHFNRRYKPNGGGAESAHLPAVVEMLKKNPAISIRDMAAHTGETEPKIARVMIFARTQLAANPAYVPTPGRRTAARDRLVKLARLMEEQPGLEKEDVARRFGVSDKYAARLMTLIQDTLAANPDHDFSTGIPGATDDRSNNARVPQVVAMLAKNPSLTPAQLASKLKVGEPYAYQLLKAARKQSTGSPS